MPAASDEDIEAVFKRLEAAMPNGEHRPGQIQMAAAIANAIAGEDHLIVQAGTGTGKTMAYLGDC